MVKFIFTIFAFFLISSAGASAPESTAEFKTTGKYLIDIADEAKPRICKKCPGYVGEMIITKPVMIDSNLTQEDIVVDSCTMTLISENTVWTASHCLKNWVKWQQADASVDCGLSIGIYFPKTGKYKSEKRRCKKVVSPVYLAAGLPQLEPDYVLVEFEKSVKRETADVEISKVQTALQIPDGPYTVWGVDSEANEYVMATCNPIDNSILTPMSIKDEGAYTVLTCDRNLERGWSGAGVYKDNKMYANVSFGFGETAFGTTLFGLNEVAVSLAACSDPINSKQCFVDNDTLTKALYYHYLLAIDQSSGFMESTIKILENTFSNFKFEYAHFSVAQGFFEFTPGFKVSCFKESLPVGVETAVRALSDLNSYNFNKVLFNDDSSVKSVLEEESDQGYTPFSLPFTFQKGKVVYSDVNRVIVNVQGLDNPAYLNHLLIQRCAP